MTASSREHIQLLLDQPREPGMVVSCYADTSVAEGFEAHWIQPLKEEATRIRRGLAAEDHHPSRREFDLNLEAIRRALESPEARQARGMAIFSAVGRHFLLALHSDVPFENRLVVDEVPYVVPLVEAYIRRQGYLVVMADTHRGRLYASRAGGSRLLDELDEDVPGKTRASGETWGKQQATIDRHRKDQILHFHKHLAERVDRACRESAYRGIVLLGEHEVLEHFRDLLPRRLARRVAFEGPHAWTDCEATIDAAIRDVIDAEETWGERRVLGELGRRLGEGWAVAAGPQEVIDALRNGQVAELVLGPDPGAVASRCDGCRSLFADERAVCPYCHASCHKGNLWQEVLDLALSHGIPVDLVRDASNLARHGGIAALLARDEPQWASAPGAAASTEMAR